MNSYEWRAFIFVYDNYGSTPELQFHIIKLQINHFSYVGQL